MRRTSAAAITLVLIGSAALAGCSDDPKPKFADPLPSTAVSPSGAPTSPQVSDSVRPPGGSSPEAAVTAWVTARNVAVTTGDASQVRDLSADGCGTCAESIDPVVAVYDDGGVYRTSGWRIASVVRDPEFGANRRVVAGLVYAAGSTVLAEGEAPIAYGTERHVAVFILVEHGPAWLVRKMVYLS